MGNGAQIVPFSKPDLSKLPKKISHTLKKSDRVALLAYAQSNSMTEAGLKWSEMRGVVNSTPQAAEAHMSRKIADIRRRLEEAGTPELFWEALGLDAMRIARALGEGLEATLVKPMVIRKQEVVRAVSSRGVEYDKVIETEEIIDAGPYVDHQNRLRAAEVTARLRGDLKKAESMTVKAGVEGEGFKFVFMVEQR